MNKNKIEIYVVVKIAWWVKPYLFGVAVTQHITNQTPNWEKVHLIVAKGITCKVTNKKPLKQFTA